MPFGENTRYDLIVDRGGGQLSGVQCKTGRLRDGTVRFATASTYGHLPTPREIRRDYAGEIDEFAVYCPETQGIYVLAIDDVRTKSAAYLRVDAPRNRQSRGVRRASDFHVATVGCAIAPPLRIDADGATLIADASRSRLRQARPAQPGARVSCA